MARSWTNRSQRKKSLSKKEVRNSVELYKKFLSLKRKYPDSVLVPTGEIDSVWHTHILDTKNYADDCNMLFGKFMHHKPYFGPYSKESQEDMARWFEETSIFWQIEYGEVLQDPNRKHSDPDCCDNNCHGMDCAHFSVN